MRKDPRPLQIKIRVTARKGMIQSQEDLIAILQETVSTRVVPDGVVIHWIDWQKGMGGKANSGRIDSDLAQQLEAFWFAIAHEDSEVALKKVEIESREGRKRVGRKPSSPKTGRRPR
jgi:hypothetical protein